MNPGGNRGVEGPMSLSHLLKAKDVRAQLNRITPDYRRTLSATTNVEKLGGPHQLIGTAFDYALRFEIGRRCPSARGERWVAENGVRRLELGRALAGTATLLSTPKLSGPSRDLDRLARRARRWIDAAREQVPTYQSIRAVRRSDLTVLAELTLTLARLDVVARCGDPSALRSEPSAEEREELVRLLEVVPFQRLALAGDVFLNPTFSSASEAVGGADADLVIDGRLLDIKTLANSFIERPAVHQLLGYLMLARHARRRDTAFPRIRSVGLYFARQAAIWEIDVEPIVRSETFADVERWFAARARLDQPAPRARSRPRADRVAPDTTER